jgi:hypothetical protein
VGVQWGAQAFAVDVSEDKGQTLGDPSKVVAPVKAHLAKEKE